MKEGEREKEERSDARRRKRTKSGIRRIAKIEKTKEISGTRRIKKIGKTKKIKKTRKIKNERKRRRSLLGATYKRLVSTNFTFFIDISCSGVKSRMMVQATNEEVQFLEK